jgi:hypothetical protein
MVCIIFPIPFDALDTFITSRVGTASLSDKYTKDLAENVAVIIEVRNVPFCI